MQSKVRAAVVSRLAVVTVTGICICLGGSGCEAVTSRHDVHVSRLVDQQSIRTLAVLEFAWTRPVPEKAPKGWSYGHMGSAGEVVANAVAASLLKLNMYTIKERSEIKRILDEHELQLSELLANGRYMEVGRLTGVDGLVIGHVSLANLAMKGILVQIELSFDCRCVSTRTGNVHWTMAGSKSVTWANKIGPWTNALAEELMDILKDRLEHPGREPPPGPTGRAAKRRSGERQQ